MTGMRTTQGTPSLFDAAAEKRIRHVVYCGDQLIGKKMKLWQTRYERAVAACLSLAELDEALRRLNEKYPEIGIEQATYGAAS